MSMMETIKSSTTQNTNQSSSQHDVTAMMNWAKQLFHSCSHTSCEDITDFKSSLKNYQAALTDSDGESLDVPQILEKLTDRNGMTLLHIARSSTIVQYLLDQNGINLLQIKNKDGETPMHTASKIEKNSEIVQCMLAFIKENSNLKGVISMKDNSGNIPLHNALASMDLDSCTILLEAHIESGDTTELSTACSNTTGGIANALILANICDRERIHNAFVLDFLKKINIYDQLLSNQPPPLILLAAAGNLELLICLLKILWNTERFCLSEVVDPQGFNILHALLENDKGLNDQDIINLLAQILENSKDSFHALIHTSVGGMTAWQCTSHDSVKQWLVDIGKFDSQSIMERQKRKDTVSKDTVSKDTPLDTPQDNSIVNSEDHEKVLRQRLIAGYDAEPDDHMPSAEDLHKLETLKAEGTSLVSKQDYGGAIEKYIQCIEKCVKVQKTRNFRSIIASNLSLCYIKLQKFEDALEEARKCIALNASWWKGYLRLALALDASGDPAEAAQQIYLGMLVEQQRYTEIKNPTIEQKSQYTANTNVMKQKLQYFVDQAKKKM